MIVDGNFIAANLPAYAVFASILAVLLGIVFLSRSLRSNKSHGIIDDGTGVAILLELSKLVKARPIPGYKFIFGFYGSEESGLIGSTYDYMKREIDKDRLRVISVDMIGEKPPLAYVKKIALIRGAIMDPTLNEQIVSIAESLDIEIEGKNFPYSGSDFAPFMLLGGCRANWIINRSRLIHSKNDHLGNVNEILVNDAMKLIAGYLLQLEA
jgi:putative aminopeptidase FrvX